MAKITVRGKDNNLYRVPDQLAGGNSECPAQQCQALHRGCHLELLDHHPHVVDGVFEQPHQVCLAGLSQSLSGELRQVHGWAACQPW